MAHALTHVVAEQLQLKYGVNIEFEETLGALKQTTR